MRISHRSLTLRLTGLFAAAATAVLVFISYLFTASLDVHFQHEDAMELAGKTELIAHLLAKVQSDSDLPQLRERLQDALIGHQALFVSLRDASGKLLFASPADLYPIDESMRNTVTHVEMGIPISSPELKGHFYRVASTTANTDAPSLPGVRMTVAMSIDHHQQFIDAVRRTVWIAVAAGAALSGLLGWFAARLGLAPVRSLAKLTSMISANRLNTRLSEERLPPELADVGKSFNEMLSRLEDSFRRLNEFSSDLAHELRTPISNLQTHAQVAVSRSRSAEEYREVIYSAMEEYERLARMITDMLFLARADNGQLIPAQEEIDLRRETEALFEFYDALVEEQHVSLIVEGDATVLGDRIMLRRALSNLLSNAIRHCTRGGTVRVGLASDVHGTTMTVTNPGTPIPAEHLPRLFDRFYRVDPARQRSSEGAGLGLAITRTIVAAHGGTISATSDPNLTRLQIRLPASRTVMRSASLSLSNGTESRS